MSRPIPRLNPSDLARFWSNVSNRDGRGCTKWTGTLDRYGYGIFGLQYSKWKAHRISWTLVNGPIREGLELDHLCRNTACVAADHLEPVTHAENMRRGLSGAANRAKTRCPQGHEYTAENTKLYQGRRYCRECHRQDSRRRRARQRTEKL